MMGSEQLGEVAWYASPSAVEQAMNETGLFSDHVIIEVPARLRAHVRLVR